MTIIKTLLRKYLRVFQHKKKISENQYATVLLCLSLIKIVGIAIINNYVFMCIQIFTSSM